LDIIYKYTFVVTNILYFTEVWIIYYITIYRNKKFML